MMPLTCFDNSLAEQGTDQQQVGLHPTDSGGAGVVGDTPHTCGPWLEDSQDECIPQDIRGFRPPNGLGGEATPHNPLNKPSISTEGGISPGISPSPETTASAEKQEIIVTTEIKKIALEYTRPFMLDEITSDVVKSMSISPSPTTRGDWGPWRKRVSNVIGRMVKKGSLVRKKQGSYSRAVPQQESHQTNADGGGITLEPPQVDAGVQRDRWLELP